MLVIIDKNIENKNRDIYLNQIKKNLENVDVINFDDDELRNYLIYSDKILVLEPMNKDFKKFINTWFTLYPNKDIEGSYSGNLTITAMAILEVLGDVSGKIVVIINQSRVLGIPLAKELLNKGANVISLNSKYKSLDNLLTMTDIDILISASGNSNFKIERFLTENIEVKIDLSNDLEDPKKIRSIPTIKTLIKKL